MAGPRTVPTQETVAFIARQLQPGGSVLEVGCGDGLVAARLRERGFRVTGVEADAARVDEARLRGVPVVRATWPDFEGGTFDVVAFTGSLHQIGPLLPAVRRAVDLLNPGGVVAVDDFAVEAANKRTLEWFVRAISRAHTSMLDPNATGLVGQLLAGGEPLASWLASHDVDVHNSNEMILAIREHLQVREITEVPYLYRYLTGALPDTPASAVFVGEVFQGEAAAGRQGDIALIGRRIVAERRS